MGLQYSQMTEIKYRSVKVDSPFKKKKKKKSSVTSGALGPQLTPGLGSRALEQNFKHLPSPDRTAHP